MNPYQKSNQAYKKASVATTDQSTLILMMYNGAIKFLKAAKSGIEKKNFEAANLNLNKAKSIISELSGSLDLEKGGDVGKNLRDLYNYIYDRLIEANVHRRPDLIDEVIALLLDLREGWNYIWEQKKPGVAKETESAKRGKSVKIKG